MLLDSPFREIHALRFADNGTIYAAAVNGAQGGEAAPTDRAAAGRTRAAAGAVGLDRDHLDRRSSTARPARRRRRRRRAAAKPAAAGRSTASRPTASGTRCGNRRRRAVRPRSIERRQPAGRHRQQGQDLPPRRRSGAPDAARARRGAAGHGAPPRAVGPDRRRDQQSRQAVRARRPTPAPRGTYESDVRDAGTVATWGVIRWRAAARRRRSRSLTRSGNTATPDETWSAWSTPYTNADGEPIASPKARYLQWRAVLTGDGAQRARADLGDGRLSAAQPAARGPSITVHPPGTVFQRPFSTGELEIAGFEDNTSDGRPPTQAPATPRPAAASPRRPRSAAASTEGAADARLEGRRRERRRPAVRRAYRREGETTWKALQARALRTRSSSGTRRRCPTAPTSSRSRRPTRRRTRPARRSSASSRASSFDIDNTPPAIELQSATRAGARATITVRRPRRPVGGAARRVLARRQPLARRLSDGRHSGLAARGVRAGARRDARRRAA